MTHGTHCHSSHPHPDLPIKHTWHAFPDYLKEDQTTLLNITSGRITQYIRMINICHPDTMVQIIDWSKQVSHIITTSCHGPRSTTCRVKGQDEVTTSHFHDHFTRSLSAAHRVMIALPPPKCHHNSTKYLPTIKEAIKASDTIYINLHTRRRESLLYLVKGQLIYLSPKPWLTKPSEGASGHPVRMPFLQV